MPIPAGVVGPHRYARSMRDATTVEAHTDTRDGGTVKVPQPCEGYGSPMLHLKRHQDDGLFDRFAYHVKELWQGGRDIWVAK